MNLPKYTVAVRELCEFTAKHGDLDLRFTPSPSAQEGIAGHKLVAARRTSGYRAEMPLSCEFEQLTVRGRADGYDAEHGVLEEIKTYRGDLDRMPSNHRALHWAQAKIYGAMLCQQLGLEKLTLSLVYFEISTQQETCLTQSCDFQELKTFFETSCGRFLDWGQREIEHREQRDAALKRLQFPHAEFRTGQRALAESVFRAAQRGECLMAQAPTGIGKTIATIFPLLKACPSHKIDKIFFLTAKGSGRALALDAINTLNAGSGSAPLRVTELWAREKACEHPDKACHGESCPLAKGFYDRLPAAREAAISAAANTRQSMREIALKFSVCPYYLTQEMLRWSDIVIGDYNYFYDSTAILHGLTAANQWSVAVLVDEAHNLVDRARAMYSAELCQDDLQQLRKSAPASLQPPLDRAHRVWNLLIKNQNEFYQVYPALPQKFLTALQNAVAAIAEFLAAHPTEIDSALLRFYFDALQFGRLAESFGKHSLFDVRRSESKSARGRPRATTVLCIRNVVPAPFLAPRFASARATVLFSATLTPQHFYMDTLGLPANTAWVEAEAPFKAEQLKVRIVHNVSTRYQNRAASLLPIAQLIAAQFKAAPGNYLAFFSSFEYLRQAALTFSKDFPEIPMIEQVRHMGSSEQADFLARFTPASRCIGFAVLGGAFSEGIDLPGTRLIGAFIATLGLPQFNPINQAMKLRMDASFGAGYDYTYLFPGLRKVVQAAGRVIRSPADRGAVYLIDDRYSQSEIIRLLPSWWNLDDIRLASGQPHQVRC